jgi:hypothetical protein
MIKTIIDSVKSVLNPQVTKRPAALTKDVLYFRAGRIAKGHEGVETNWSCEGSVGWKLGLRPKFLHLSLSGEFSKSEISTLLTPAMLAKADPKWLKTRKVQGEIKYKLVPGPFLPHDVVSKLWEAVKEISRVSEVDLLPTHPTWLYEKGLGINFCIRRLGTKSFKEAIGARRDIFYRAGKDLWKVPLFTKKARVLVVESVPNSDDGNMWSRSDKNFMYLVRSAFTFNNQPLMLKGRVIGVPTIPGSESWPEGEYDIVTSQHNIKWGEIPAGTILEMDVDFVLNENHSKEEESIEERKLTILALLLAKINPSYQDWILASFYSNATNLAKFVNDYTHLDLKGLVRLLKDEPKNLIALDQALKVRMGFIRDEDTLSEIRDTLLRKLRSTKIPGQWLAAIARDVVPVGQIWMSIHDKLDMLVNEATVIRYPVTGYQSFITLEVVYRNDLPKGLAMVNGSDAKYLALDGDDHILVTKPFSSFRGGEPLMSERSESIKLDLKSLSFMQLYVSGANAQGMIGFCFNAMASTLGLKEVAKSAGNSEKVTELESMAERLGMLLDMLAQAIKKPYQLDTEVIQLASAIKLTTAQHPVTAICLSKELDQASELEWGVTIPSMKPAEVFNNGLVGIPEIIINMIVTGLKKASSAPNGRQELKVITALARDLKDWVKTQPDLEAAAMTYYTIAVRAIKRDPSSQLVKLMDGSILLLGRTLCEQRYSPLFQE